MTYTELPARVQDALTQQADQVCTELAEQDARWRSGFTRRRFLAGAGMVGVAALGTQLVTTRASFGATPANNGNTLIVIFLRGGADGLRLLVPAPGSTSNTYLASVRPHLLPAAGQLRALSGAPDWSLNAAFDPLLPLWSTGELAFVPAVSSSVVSRSHFQAQQVLEGGGSDTVTTGWLDRLLANMGPGTTFRAVADGYAAPASLGGSQRNLVLDSLAAFSFPGWDGVAPQSITAIESLYRGVGGPLGEDVPTTMAALAQAETARAQAGVKNGASYPSGAFGQSLADLATLLRAEVGMQIATVDVGGWDTHTNEAQDLDAVTGAAAKALAAFMTDLGPTRRGRVTVAVMTEFGRRVAENDSGGTDHGHGSVMWLLGGGLSRAAVFGRWTPLSTAVLDQGDVPALNSPFDVLGELASTRLGAGLTSVFPGQTIRPLGVAR